VNSIWNGDRHRAHRVLKIVRPGYSHYFQGSKPIRKIKAGPKAQLPMSAKRNVDQPVDQIHGDRRCNRRYDISLNLRWKVMWRRKVRASGMGTTIDLSSNGILFRAEDSLRIGEQVELSIPWPAFIDGFPPVQLIVYGIIVRSDQNRNAIRMTRHEFRTVAVAQHSSAAATGKPKVISISPD
jgi:hypothetical protein